MRRVLLLVVVSTVALAGCAVPPPGAPAPEPGGTGTPGWAEQMIAAVNAERARVGAPPVQLCPSLMTAAQRHSEDQAARSTMSHTGGDGSNMVQRAERAGYTGWTAMAENVAAGQPDVGSVMAAWMGSSGHRTNILGASYQHVGVGVAVSGGGARYWTQVFGRSGRC